MTTRITLGLALCGAAALAIAQFSAAGRPAAPDDKAKAAPAEAKGARAAEFVAAFDKGDAKAVAAFWTPDGDYVDQLGRRYKGRAEIEKLYAKLFAANKGAKLTVAVTSVRPVGADAAIEDGTTVVTPAGGAPTSGTFTAVLVKKDGAWFFESVRETVTHPATNAEHLEELEWLVGDWEGEGGDKGASGVASYEWAENGNFLVSHFAATLDGEPVAGGTQWIGWDAADKQVRSWSFYSGGGFGEAVWAKDKDAAKWTLKTTAKTADGKKVTLTNVITKVDDDHMTWQPTQVTVDGAAAPDGPVVKMKRAK